MNSKKVHILLLAAAVGRMYAILSPDPPVFRHNTLKYNMFCSQ